MKWGPSATRRRPYFDERNNNLPESIPRQNVDLHTCSPAQAVYSGSKYSNGNQSAVWGLTTMVPSWRSVIASSQQRSLLNGEATWDETAFTDSCRCVKFWFRYDWKYNADRRNYVHCYRRFDSSQHDHWLVS